MKNGEKADCFLQISQIASNPGSLTINSSGFTETFRAYYSDLYISESPDDDVDMLNFFKWLNVRHALCFCLVASCLSLLLSPYVFVI